MSRQYAGFVRLLIVLALPILVVLTAARLLITDWYPTFEYAKANFPRDMYGFSQAQRLELGLESIHFLQDPRRPESAIAILQAQRLPGTNDPLFNQNELSHMIDVKRFTDLLCGIHFAAATVFFAGLALLFARRRTRPDAYAALRDGGILTSGLLTFLVLAVLVSWRTFFIAFHDAFFPPGTWTFNWSDSLIRLFPDRFWFDAGTLLTASSLAAGLVIGLAGFILVRRTRARRR